MCHSALVSGSSASSARSPVEVAFSQAADRAILLNLFQSAQHRLIGKVVELLAAQIIVAAFHVANGKPPLRTFVAGCRFSKQRMLKKRNILVEKLFLKILCAGRDDHPLARADHRHQIRQRLSRARAGFHNQVPLFFEGLLDPLRHLQLPPSEFISGMRVRKHSARRKELMK